MQAPPEAAFAPMPLRVRGVLENLDVSIKAFKQYFWVMVAWAAIVNGINSIPFVSYFSWFFTPPLIIGAAACCVAAAVRGQRVSFVQCWRFTQPRFWSIVGMHVCALLVAGLVVGLLGGMALLAVVAGAYLFGSAPGNVTTTVIVIASVIGLVLFGIAVTALTAWHTLVGIVACMEDDKRNTSALARAWELLRGQWWPVISLMMLLGLGVVVLWLIIGAAGLMMGGLSAARDLFNGTPSDANSLIALVGFFFSSWLVMTFYTPIHYLAMTLVYLDLRVRKEALDIEWTAHQTAPTPLASWDATPTSPTSFNGMAAQGAPSTVAPPPAHWVADPDATPAQSTLDAPDTLAGQTPQVIVSPSTTPPVDAAAQSTLDAPTPMPTPTTAPDVTPTIADNSPNAETTPTPDGLTEPPASNAPASDPISSNVSVAEPPAANGPRW